MTLGEGPLTNHPPVSHKPVLVKMAVVDESPSELPLPPTHERESSYEQSFTTSEEVNSQDGSNDHQKYSE